MKSKKLNQLEGSYLEFTQKKGVLRCVKPGEALEKAQGIYFKCPVCTPEFSHGNVLLFDLPSVPKEAKPEGRYHPSYGIKALGHLTVDEEIKSTSCKWSGKIVAGEVRWND